MRKLVKVVCIAFPLLILFYNLYPLVLTQESSIAQRISDRIELSIDTKTMASTEGHHLADQEIGQKPDPTSLKNTVREPAEYLDLSKIPMQKISKETQTKNYLTSMIMADWVSVESYPPFSYVGDNITPYTKLWEEKIIYIDPVVRSRSYIQLGRYHSLQ